MLAQLHIKNMVLIEEIFVEFNKGLNILTGETGSGKSIIINSLNFVLGGKITKGFINKDSEKANVDLLITIKDKEVMSEILELGIDIEEDNSILISRTFTRSGKSISRINGKLVTITMLKEIASKLVDIHGQNYNQSILNSKEHINLLDKFCEKELTPIKEELKNSIKNYKKVIKKLSDLDLELDINNRNKKIDFLKYQLKEIENANLEIDEEEKLIQKRSLISSYEKSKKLYINALDLLYRNENNSVMDKTSIVLNNILNIYEIDKTKKDIYDEINIIYIKLEELVSKLNKYSDNIDFDEQEFNYIENRLQEIYNLKRKYGKSIEKILEFKENVKNKLDFLINSEGKILELLKHKEILEKEIKKKCFEISEIRKVKALEIEREVEKNLFDLGMKNIKFKILVEIKNKFTNNGFNNVEFLISTNIKEELKPISKVASGGEMSRVMLSLKSVLSSVDIINTFVFDEIDTGVSGRTAQKIAEKLYFLSRDKQIICITHLPQIASMADKHFLIEKLDHENKTVTTIKNLDEKEIVNELARMTGGAEITEKTLIAVKEIRQQAKEKQNTIRG